METYIFFFFRHFPPLIWIFNTLYASHKRISKLNQTRQYKTHVRPWHQHKHYFNENSIRLVSVKKIHLAMLPFVPLIPLLSLFRLLLHFKSPPEGSFLRASKEVNRGAVLVIGWALLYLTKYSVGLYYVGSSFLTQDNLWGLYMWKQ